MAIFFVDKALEEEFEKNGFVIVPMLSTEEINELKAIYQSHFQASPDHFYSSSFIKDPETKDKINKSIQKVFEPHIVERFRNIQPLGSSFLVKPPGEPGRMEVHQDWTIVDETMHYSVTIWVPLIDTTAENGAIRVLPGSHRLFEDIRGPSIPAIYENIYKDIWNEMELLEMKAGEAFIFSHSLIHASNTNTTDRDRIAATFGFFPSEAQLFFYHLNEGKKLEKYEVPDSFFQEYTNIGQRPQLGKKVAELDYTPRTITNLHFKTKLSKLKPMIPLFKDTAVQREFEENGYVRLPMLDQDEVMQLVELYRETGIKDEAGYGFFISMDNEDHNLVSRTMDRIYEIALPKAMQHFGDVKAFTASFVIKDPNPKGVVPIHQDWTFVDNEGEFVSVTCWIALVDTTMENGALGAIKGSHRFLPSVRPSPSPQVVSPLRDLMFSVFPYVKIEEMKAGEALIFDNRTFHASPPNVTEHPRLAVGLGFTHKDAQLAHYYMKPDGNQNKILKYAIDKDFFRKYNNALLSKMFDKGELIEGYSLVAEEDYTTAELDKDALLAEIKASGNEFNVPLVEKLAALFNYNLDGTKKEDSGTNGQKNGDAVPEDKPFWKVYTPYNIYREIRYRLTGK